MLLTEPGIKIVLVGVILSLAAPISLAQQWGDTVSVPEGTPKSATNQSVLAESA